MVLENAASGQSPVPVAFSLVEEINHRVVNEYSEAIASLNLAASRAGDNRLKAELANAAERLRDHAEAHRALMPPRTAERENIADYIGRICNSFARATLAERGLLLTLHTADILLPASRCWRLGLIVAELIRNAARHGRFDSTGRIMVHIADHAGEVRCLVRDTGTARAKAEPGRGQGLIRALVAELEGMVEWSFTAEGCLVLVRIPAKDDERARDLIVAGETL
ncbi:ATP-binding protein [Flavisphingomonas formosensis]|uniref:ATP-binding protein n=1 Tax=Flavisphingomonas formosensis TaxID=861534 RepID=UPI0012F84DF3|nr:ATP-binding protein [Sphingomonas formosensis]